MVKPLHFAKLREVGGAALKARQDLPAADPPAPGRDELGSRDGLVGDCPAMQEVYKAIGRVAARRSTS